MKKEAFLANIRHQLKSARLPQAEPEGPAPLVLVEPPSVQAMIEQFTDELRAVNGHIHAVESSEQAFQQLEALFEQYKATGYLAWDDDHLPIEGAHEHLVGRGYTRAETHLPHDIVARAEQQVQMAEMQIGVTGALAALADTGSIVVQAGPGRGRFASILPFVHVALVEVKQLYATLHHFIRAMPRANFESSNVVVITGPSRTADIEGILTLGVHGPKELHVILLPA